ncbi:hypothetical protein EG328_004214 [Venturia inaequalis]|uniref:Uncharacterized protein n=1 Tax=Venturia inaequalis TaxID=5025 RepID=A0A8H3UY12_VENIN|nr:hypothetical protein EG328_004214 [Venturia inaequalis]KAE9978440.1 hypothetical protein EG327_007405 [Venturia inaequalis]RDI88032.1 hypothetical protein Vi05172_g1968 [Venturia inaequalis]
MEPLSKPRKRRLSKDGSEHRDQRHELEKKRTKISFQCRRNHNRDLHKTTFLTLPHELRQQILLDTYDAAEPLPNLSDANLWTRHRELYEWAVTLRSAEMCLYDDIYYVLTRWFKEFGAWHDLEMQKVNDLNAKINELTESLSSVPPAPPIGTPLPFVNMLGILMLMERSQLLERVRRIMGLDG